MNKGTIIFRWIAVLPCAALVSYLTQLLVTNFLLAILQAGSSSATQSSAILNYVLFFTVNALAGYAFVFVGTWCAPARHKQVALGLMLFASIAILVNCIMSNGFANPLNYAIVIGRIVGAILGVMRFKNYATLELQ